MILFFQKLPLKCYIFYLNIVDIRREIIRIQAVFLYLYLYLYSAKYSISNTNRYPIFSTSKSESPRDKGKFQRWVSVAYAANKEKLLPKGWSMDRQFSLAWFLSAVSLIFLVSIFVSYKAASPHLPTSFFT